LWGTPAGGRIGVGDCPDRKRPESPYTSKIVPDKRAGFREGKKGGGALFQVFP
jgi:hypothetical protein